MQEKIRIENLQESNIEDLIYVCSSKRLNDPIHQQGIRLKRRWLREMLEKCGHCAKIAYYNEKPVAQILYYPEEADITKAFRRENVLVIDCIYNPTPEAQKLGIGTRLLYSVIEDARQRKTCLGNKPCKFILAKAFNTGELLPMPEFYKKKGFLPTPEGNQLYLPIEGSYEPVTPVGEYEPLLEDKDKAVIFYGPICQFSYQFAKRIEEILREVVPNIGIEMVNEWEKPEEAIKRKNWWLIVNAKPIQTFFMETEKFKEEIKQAVSENS
ncbi:MAG: GNAT family N-acetyltransferase [Candidatus Bathyarchaeota archaeon]|nr:GNAT family N-acetyltransferase [Candidatus Bathyarchaeota archaeon]